MRFDELPGAVRPLLAALVQLVLLGVVTYQTTSLPSSSVARVYMDPGELGDEQPLNPLARLALALDNWEKAPILEYEEALRINEQTCAGRGIQSNPDQIKGEVTFWRSLSSLQIREKRSAIISGVRDVYGLPGLLYSDGAGHLNNTMTANGRGIVYTGGNADTLQRLYTSVRILRQNHGCKLPIEVFTFPEEMRDAPGQGLRGQIEALGDVVFKTLHSSPKLELWKNFQIKGESIVKSSFSEVLYLDSDNIALTDPTYLFDHPQYKKHGVVFWPDITKDGPANPIWRITGMQCRPDEWQLDSGQIIIDKKGQGGLNMAALVAAAKMQENHQFWFKVSGGDKDTFRYAFYALGLPFTPASHWLSSYGLVHDYAHDGHTFCGLAMFQYGLSPDDWERFPKAVPDIDFKRTHAPPLFVHANLLKHSSGYQRGQTFTTVKRMKRDLVSEPMNRPRSVVYQPWQGMCVDIWDAFDDVDPRPGGTYDDGEVIIENAADAFGGVLRGFEDM